MDGNKLFVHISFFPSLLQKMKCLQLAFNIFSTQKNVKQEGSKRDFLNKHFDISSEIKERRVCYNNMRLFSKWLNLWVLLSKFCRQVEKRFSRYSRESAFNLANEQRFTLKYLTFYYYHESKSFIAINGINLPSH